MTATRIGLLLVLIVIASSVGVGVVTSTDPPTEEPVTMGTHISTFMQAQTAQTNGAVENGMWVAAYANASNESVKHELVEHRLLALNDSIDDLLQERRALKAAYRSGNLTRTEYRIELATITGQIAAISQGINHAGVRGLTVGVNESRLDDLRNRAHDLAGSEVSQLARNLTGDHGPPGPEGAFAGNRTTGGGDQGANGPRGNQSAAQPQGNASATESIARGVRFQGNNRLD